jgi:TPR repeat protein
VPRDYVRAYVWFDRAAAQTPLEDNRKALIELRDIAAVRMSPGELDLARLMVRDLLPTR